MAATGKGLTMFYVEGMSRKTGNTALEGPFKSEQTAKALANDLNKPHKNGRQRRFVWWVVCTDSPL